MKLSQQFGNINLTVFSGALRIASIQRGIRILPKKAIFRKSLIVGYFGNESSCC
jgi:hypothetical protein